MYDQDLMGKSLVFAKLIEEYGNLEREDEDKDGLPDKKGRKKEGEGNEGTANYAVAKKGAVLMQTEERNVGAVTWDVYKRYLRFGGGLVWAPVVVGLLALTQGTQGTLPKSSQ